MSTINGTIRMLSAIPTIKLNGYPNLTYDGQLKFHHSWTTDKYTIEGNSFTSVDLRSLNIFIDCPVFND